MRRIISVCGLCAVLLGALLPGAMAQDVSVATSDNLKYDISLRDADLATVLTALFNTTDNKRQVTFGNGVAGRIAKLQLSQTSFDQALDAILGTDFSYKRVLRGDGVYVYTIVGRQSGGDIYSPRPSIYKAPPVSSTDAVTMPDFSTGGTRGTATTGYSGGYTGPSYTGGATTGAGGASTTGGSSILNLGRSGLGDTTGGAAASSESFIVKLLRINYLDVGALADFLGGDSVDLNSLLDTANSGDSGGGSGRRGSGSTRNSGGSTRRNNNNTNNNDNNNNNNNNNNNRNTDRNTRTNSR